MGTRPHTPSDIDFGKDETRPTQMATVTPKPETSLLIIHEALEQRLAVERRRNFRAFCWMSAAFLLVLLAVASLLLSLGMMVSRNARKAIDSASRTAEWTDLALKSYDERIVRTGTDIEKLGAKAEEINRNVEREKGSRLQEKESLKQDLVQFSKWYGTKNAWVDGTLSQFDELNRKVAEMEATEAASKAKLAELQKLYEDLRASSVQSASLVVAPAPVPVQVEPARVGKTETVVYGDGGKYEGELKDGLKHGVGTYYFANGDKYTGEFAGDLRHGKGSYSYATGARYEGEFKEGQRSGSGIYYYPNGDVFQGSFAGGLMNGSGFYTYSGGVRVQGVWKDDVLVSGD